jgi:hypothetical protein
MMSNVATIFDALINSSGVLYNYFNVTKLFSVLANFLNTFSKQNRVRSTFKIQLLNFKK